jgi:uncharacterized membrane protein YphA (DoxX/SURF4 family)
MEIENTSAAATESIYRQLPVALLRLAIGWHFLYEGLSKLLANGWSSGGYLLSAAGPLGGVFHWMGTHPALVRALDQVNVWGMIFIGLGLMLGIWTRVAAAAGALMLAMFYLAYPPLFERVAQGVNEGQYLIVNKNLVELFALSVIFAFPAAAFGLGVLLRRVRNPGLNQPQQLPAVVNPLSRRDVVHGLVGLPVLGVFALAVLRKHGWRSFEETHLSAQPKSHPADVQVASATVKRFDYSTLRELRGQVPQARIANKQFSRMILGGNLIAGYAHARDLIYVSKLVQAYHTRSRIFQTLDLAESCGINTLLTNPVLSDVIRDYWRVGGKIQFISDCGFGDVVEMVKKSIDKGACSCYIQGGTADSLVEKGAFDAIAKALELTRSNGLPAGIGAHKLKTVQECVARGLAPDYWMKTLHPVDYWSAQVKPVHDNCWCDDPEATTEFMHELEQPWIAFKVLGAGAIKPETGFRYAFEKGADFICVGMYDFQVVDDVNIVLDVLNSSLSRRRQWRA